MSELQLGHTAEGQWESHRTSIGTGFGRGMTLTGVTPYWLWTPSRDSQAPVYHHHHHHPHVLQKSRAINRICRAVQKHSVLISRHCSHYPYMHTSHITYAKHSSHSRRTPTPVPADSTYLHCCSIFSNGCRVPFEQSVLLQIFIVVRNALKIVYTCV